MQHPLWSGIYNHFGFFITGDLQNESKRKHRLLSFSDWLLIFSKI